MWPQQAHLLFPKFLCHKTSGLIVTQITWPQKSYLLFPNYVATKEAGLLLLKVHDWGKVTCLFAGPLGDSDK
jgi:hypothetical protein